MFGWFWFDLLFGGVLFFLREGEGGVLELFLTLTQAAGVTTAEAAPNGEWVWNNPAWLGWKVWPSGANCLLWGLSIPLMRILLSAVLTKARPLPSQLHWVLSPDIGKGGRGAKFIPHFFKYWLHLLNYLVQKAVNQKADIHFVDCLNICFYKNTRN